MIERYFWLSDVFENWIPESGFAYYDIGAAQLAAQTYFESSGYTNIRFSEYNEWELISSYDDGTKYSKPIITDELSLGFVFRFDLNGNPYTPDDFKKDIVTTQAINSSAATTSTGA